MLTYKFMRRCVSDWREALFMGYFGPIGIGAIQYVEHTRLLIQGRDSDDKINEDDGQALVQKMVPIVYWLVMFSIFWHGLTTPILSLLYRRLGVQPIKEDSSADSIAEDESAVDEFVADARQNETEICRERRSDSVPRLELGRVRGHRAASSQPMMRESVEMV